MRSARVLVAGPVAVVLALVLALSNPSTAVAATVLAPTGDAGRVPLGLAAVGALLGVAGFVLRQWWERAGRGKR